MYIYIYICIIYTLTFHTRRTRQIWVNTRGFQMKPGVLVFLGGPVFPTDVREPALLLIRWSKVHSTPEFNYRRAQKNNHGLKILVVLVVRTAPKPMIFSRVGMGKSRVWHGLARVWHGLEKPRVFLETRGFLTKITGWHGYITGLARVEHGLVDAKSQTRTFSDWGKTIPLWGR